MALKISEAVNLEELSAPLRTAFLAAWQAGQVVETHFERGVQMRSKLADQSYNLVSQADLEAEQAVVAAIRRDFPDHQIIGEEGTTGDTNAPHLWIVDPLDGTNNFAHRIPHFAVSIGYYQSGEAQCGVVVNPRTGDWYWAERGRGAYRNGQRIRVSSQPQLDSAMVGVGFYYDRGAMMEATLSAIHAFFKQQIHGIRRFGSAALDLCYVAEGLLEVFFEYQLSPWDFAAGSLIVQEAGGYVSNGHGGDLTVAASSLLATNSLLQQAALEIVASHHP